MSQNNDNIVLKSIETIETESQLKSIFIFTIKDFIDLNNSEIKSSDFSIGDTKWYISVIPRDIEDNMEFICVYLYLTQSKRDVNKAKYSVSVINDKNELFNTTYVEIHDYSNDEEGWGKDIIRRDRLTPHLLPNKQLKLHFVIKLFECKLNNENLIANHLQKLVNNNKYSDFLFIVDNKQLFAHKNILSVRSKVFEAMFANDIIESHSNQCIIDDIESDVFEQLLTFIYTANAPKAQSMAHKLIAAAEKYEILDLKRICEHFIFKDLTNENAIQSLLIADKYNGNNILNKIIEFIANNFESILNISVIEWEKFIVENPKLVTKILKTITKKREPIIS
jgi:speckle-type POZ protein